MTADDAPAAAPARSRSVVTLAVSLVLVELLAGMQRYLSQTVLPLVAADLDGAHLYGPLDAAAQAPMFLTMPLGAWLLSRFRVGRLLVVLTLVTVAGAVLCALAPSMVVFIAGTAVRAAAAGALATVGMGVVARGLPPRHRQLVLAAMSGVWLVSSVLGPVYAAGVATTLGWRWAMVLYLPVLLVVRLVVARSAPERPESVPTEPAPWGWALVLAAGSAVLALPVGAWWPLVLPAGAALMVGAAARILPAGTLRARSGRRAGLTALGVTAAVYFGATMVLSVVAHDALGLGTRDVAVVVAAPGLLWAAVALWTGSHPASTDAAFRRRAALASGSLAAGVLVLLLAVLVAGAGRAGVLAALVAGGGLLGAGMGTVYPDLLGRCLTPPARDDGISEDRVAAAVVLAESVGMALATTAAYAWLGGGSALLTEPVDRARVLYAVLLGVAVVVVRRLLAAARPDVAGTAAGGAGRQAA
ncbi:MFS transporter [Cellulomonas sp. P4]|uniref:MFS transporter n=1 Tax=Cellulomonas sp. P4 TaxID=3142533 RepID=UPI0031B9B2BD